MQEAISEGYYDVSSYEDIKNDSEIYGRIIVQEFTYWMIITGWDIKKDLLPKLVSGDVIGTLAVTEDLFAPSKDNIKLSCESGKINGKKLAVPDASMATHALVGAKSDKGVGLQVADLSHEGVSIEHQENIDESRGHF